MVSGPEALIIGFVLRPFQLAEHGTARMVPSTVCLIMRFHLLQGAGLGSSQPWLPGPKQYAKQWPQTIVMSYMYIALKAIILHTFGVQVVSMELGP